MQEAMQVEFIDSAMDATALWLKDVAQKRAKREQLLSFQVPNMMQMGPWLPQTCTPLQTSDRDRLTRQAS